MPKRVRRHEVCQPHDKPYRLIPLTQGKNAIVDAADFKWLSKWNWYVSKDHRGWYARRAIGNKKHISMHVAIMRPQTGHEVDHRNFDGLDNRRKNLRICTHTQNMSHQRMQVNNTSGFKGVCWNKPRKKWVAQISLGNRKRHLGIFTSRSLAALVYDEAAFHYRGKFAHLNYPKWA